jgi:methylphosphotriester-DNA--protein-cysteine methyltransferase
VVVVGAPDYRGRMVASYREHPSPAGLTELVACLWENPTVRVRPQLVVPDGCVDLVWFGDGRLHVVGADTGPHTVEPVGSTVTGIRLRPGAAGAVLGVPASEVRDQRVDLALLWGGAGAAAAERMADAPSERHHRILAREVLRRRAAPDPLVAAAARALARPAARVATVAGDLGVSERQLRRRTLHAIGYGPKTLARVARLRRLVALGGEELAVRAVLAGYASQSHMTEEVRRLTGRTPVRFLEDARLTAA